ESKVEQPALANASRSPDVRTTIDLESDESPSPKAATLRYSPSTPAESAPGSVAQKKEPQDIYTDVGIFGDFPDTGDEIPEYGNTHAPKFEKHEHHLSENAIRCRARRIFTPRVDGSKKVSETVFKEWHSKGQPRKNLEQIFKQCGYDPDTFVAEVEILRSEMQSTEFEIEAEFLTHDEMESRGMTPSRIEAIKKHCVTNPKKLMRRDLYEKTMRYYCEISVKTKSKKASRLEINKRAKFEESGVSNMNMDLHDGGNDDDDSDIGVDEEHVEEEVEKEKQVTNRKSLGIPELDPDALPSSHVQKYLTALAKRLTKVQQLLQKFEDKELSDIQTKLKETIVNSINALEKDHRDLSELYSQGVVSGYTKKPFIPKKAPAEKTEKPGGLRVKSKAAKAKAKGAAKAKAASKGGAPAMPATGKRPHK
ncbi:unnamed protein product, partial [Cladocopium goreaui]